MLVAPGRLLPRPMSLALAAGNELGFLIDPIGPGTRALCSLEPGDRIAILGPLGNGFRLDVERPLLVGGGIGIAPLPYLSERLGNPPAGLRFPRSLHAPEGAREPAPSGTKTATPLPREGNAPTRIAEVEGGMLNAIGLANPGRERFIADTLPRLAELGVPFWVSVGGLCAEDYAATCERLNVDEVAAIELNLSCPNVDEVPENVGDVVAAARAASTKPLDAKLSPAADVAETARAAEAAGADGLSLVNTVKGPALDERT